MTPQKARREIHDRLVASVIDLQNAPGKITVRSVHSGILDLLVGRPDAVVIGAAGIVQQ